MVSCSITSGQQQLYVRKHNIAYELLSFTQMHQWSDDRLILLVDDSSIEWISSVNDPIPSAIASARQDKATHSMIS